MASFLKRIQTTVDTVRRGTFGPCACLSMLLCATQLSANIIPPQSSSVQPEVTHVIDHGTHGELFSIDEEDMIEVLKRRLLTLKDSGKLEEFQREFNTKARTAVLEPRSVANLTPTVTERIFYVDPTLIIEGDIVLPEGVAGAGQLLARKGDRINPLKTLKLSKGMLFIDGDDAKQQHMAVRLKDAFEIVLVKGKPLEVEERLQIPVFFDQGGILTKRFCIHHVPCTMEMDGERLKFTECKVPEEQTS